MKHFMVEITYKAGPDEIAATVNEHRAFLQTGYDKGWLLMSGPQVSKTGGVVIARAPSREELQVFFSGDPYLQKKLAEYRFIEFDPVKHQEFLTEWLG